MNTALTIFLVILCAPVAIIGVILWIKLWFIILAPYSSTARRLDRWYRDSFGGA